MQAAIYLITKWQHGVWLSISRTGPQTTAELTLAMVDSGETLSWPEVESILVDKHSTGEWVTNHVGAGSVGGCYWRSRCQNVGERSRPYRWDPG